MAAAHVSGVAAMVIASGVLGNVASESLDRRVALRLKDTARSLGLKPSEQGAGLIDAARATAPPPPSGRDSLGGADDDHAARGVMGDVVGDAAEEKAAGTCHPLVANHNQVGVAFLGDVEDRLARVALDRMGLDLYPLLFGAAAAAESRTRVDVLARADLILDIGGSVLSARPRTRRFGTGA